MASYLVILSIIRIAIAGDLHGCWDLADQALLLRLQPEGVLFVGDLSEGDIRITKSIKKLPLPTAVILGNHDTGRDRSGEILKGQLALLGDLHCGWSLREWVDPKVAVVGARPCSAGGGFNLSEATQAVYGQITLSRSVELIVNAAKKAPLDRPLVILAHSGPTGLGSDFNSPCGRDWKVPSVDWGDKDLELALDEIRKTRVPDLVVFGHMHHQLRRGKGNRHTSFQDRWGTFYLNTACVPRSGFDAKGRRLCHFSWIEFLDGRLILASHRWFRNDGSLSFEEILFKSPIQQN